MGWISAYILQNDIEVRDTQVPVKLRKCAWNTPMYRAKVKN